jgi:hypothetical protein
MQTAVASRSFNDEVFATVCNPQAALVFRQDNPAE